MDETIKLFELTNNRVFYIIKDILLLVIIFYSVFLNSLMINKNMNRFKVTFILLCIALVSVWQIYYFNQYTYCLSNAIWLCALLITYAGSNSVSKRGKVAIYVSISIFIPVMFLMAYFEVFGNIGLQIMNFIIHLITATLCFYIFMLAKDVYIKVSSMMLIVTAVIFIEIILRIMPQMIDNVNILKIWSMFNWISCITFMYGVHRQVVRYL